MHDIRQVIGNYDLFLNQLFHSLEEVGIDPGELEIDHIAYRVESMERYKSLKEELTDYARLALEEAVRDRPIAIFELEEPLEYGDHEIRFLELPAPSDHHAYKEGLEHADFIVPVRLEDFLNQHSELQFKTEGLSKPTHKEISLKFGEVSAKFCTESIQEEISRKSADE